MSEISFDRLLERSRFLKRDPALVHWTPNAHPFGLGLPILNYCSAETPASRVMRKIKSPSPTASPKGLRAIITVRDKEIR
jgi:hypothetical protein